MEGWTAGGGAWRCVVGGRGEGLRRAGPVLPARGFSLRLGLGVPGSWLRSAGRARPGLAWASLAERTPDLGPRPFGAGPGRAGLGWVGPGEDSPSERVS